MPREARLSSERIMLLDRQRDLLVKLVEASEGQPGASRRKFLLAITGSGEKLLHSALPRGQMESSEADVQTLADVGLIRTARPQPDTISFFLTPLAVSYYERVKAGQRDPVARMESDVRWLIDSERFHERYPDAQRSWAAAEAELWRDSDRDVSQVGRLCREAMEAFGTALVARFKPAGTSATRRGDVERIREVIAQHEAQIGPARKRLLQDMLAYWDAVTELVRRQEHGPAGGSESATTEDARSAVLQTLVVLTEIDRSLPR